jgi:hypothetical protein
MPIELMPWLILWAALTTVVLALAIWRVTVVKREGEAGGLHVAAGDVGLEQKETEIARSLVRIDFWGKTLTVLSAILILAIGSIWLYNGWLEANKIIH